MKVTDFPIHGPLLVEPKAFGDERGFFVERYRQDLFQELGIPSNFVQDNYSRSQHGVLRGLHFQYDRPQSKLVTAASGRILDVIVDLRVKSATFGQSIAVELDGAKPSWFWVPAGFAHGFAVLSTEGADLMYKVDSYYNPKGESGIRWNDSNLNIDWRLKTPQVSERDATLPSWTDYTHSSKF